MKAVRAAFLLPLAALTALLALLAMTTAYAITPGAPLKPLVATGIAAAKAGIVLAVFMRLRQASALIRIAAGAGFVWLMILFLLGWIDYASRVS
jgi:cytochrome c oxidase subunit 4